jgi:hypothetical protein
MASQKPNMLEAFQQSARKDGTAGAATQQHSSAARPGVRTEAHTEDLLGTQPRAPRTLAAWLPVALLGLPVAMAGTYWLASQLGSETRAAGDTPASEPALQAVKPTSPAAPVTEPAPQEVAKDTRTDDDRRFLDLANRFTVRAIQYPNDKRGRRLALAAYEHLRAAGLPAISPLTLSEIVVVCVGAEPGRSGLLAQTRKRLQAISGPPPQNEPGAFEDAYDVNIDDYIDR